MHKLQGQLLDFVLFQNSLSVVSISLSVVLAQQSSKLSPLFAMGMFTVLALPRPLLSFPQHTQCKWQLHAAGVRGCVVNFSKSVSRRRRRLLRGRINKLTTAACRGEKSCCCKWYEFAFLAQRWIDACDAAARERMRREKREMGCFVYTCMRLGDNTRPNKISRASDLGGCGDAGVFETESYIYNTTMTLQRNKISQHLYI
jgi:hypothetical protein